MDHARASVRYQQLIEASPRVRREMEPRLRQVLFGLPTPEQAARTGAALAPLTYAKAASSGSDARWAP
ncbi:hypothetical protein EZ313_02210 [Ramlibacter henchirensis]|uniref:Uncharacterized protein n=1 Tax=Ramlibacter henchirensis TaxID=204072 RepID=A0A4Z0C1L0_9BURK|nr:hypothetical protein [Ramlibacter henchirensis]TFZ05507.1 hypothetical protein EZ313_02210 [Ramlibacter henchirensis]